MKMALASKRLRTLVLTVACWAIAAAAHAAVTVSNAAGIEASITGIVYYPSNTISPPSINVQFFVTAPTSTNISTFTIQKSLDLNTWANYSSMTITGSWPQSSISDSLTASSQFYRIRLSN
jgi:hypothetical protein